MRGGVRYPEGKFRKEGKGRQQGAGKKEQTSFYLSGVDFTRNRRVEREGKDNREGRRGEASTGKGKQERRG